MDAFEAMKKIGQELYDEYNYTNEAELAREIYEEYLQECGTDEANLPAGRETDLQNFAIAVAEDLVFNIF